MPCVPRGAITRETELNARRKHDQQGRQERQGAADGQGARQGMLDPGHVREGSRRQPEHNHQLGEKDEEGPAEHADYQRPGAARESLRPGRAVPCLGQFRTGLE